MHQNAEKQERKTQRHASGQSVVIHHHEKFGNRKIRSIPVMSTNVWLYQSAAMSMYACLSSGGLLF
jgi:hypothetical protein